MTAGPRTRPWPAHDFPKPDKPLTRVDPGAPISGAAPKRPRAPVSRGTDATWALAQITPICTVFEPL